jgi:hypothetical protein
MSRGSGLSAGGKKEKKNEFLLTRKTSTTKNRKN